MRRGLWGVLVGAALVWGSAAGTARGQMYGNAQNNYFGVGPYYGAPGLYGTSWGYPGYGYVSTYTAFSSPFGPGYGYGYGPTAFMPRPYGVRLWRPGMVAPGYVYGASYYNMYLAPYDPNAYAYPAPFGIYSAGLGPRPYFAW